MIITEGPVAESAELLNKEMPIIVSGKYLIFGHTSMLGANFLEHTSPESQIYLAGRNRGEFGGSQVAGFKEVDITDVEQVERAVWENPSQVIINFVAETDVNGIQKSLPGYPEDLTGLEETQSYKVNVLGTRNILEACLKAKQKGVVKLPIFISTGFVFDGKRNPESELYKEDDPLSSSPKDVSLYAWTKILAEREVERYVSEYGLDCVTIRVSYPYVSHSSRKGDFARNILNGVKKDDQGQVTGFNFPLYSDQILTPTFGDDVAPAIVFLLQKQATGIFHLTSPQAVTPFDFGVEMLRVAEGIDRPEELIAKGNLAKQQEQQLAKDLHTVLRPIYGGESSQKIIDLGFTPASWKEGIRRAFSR